MDKETLSNYGWIVVLVLVLAVMLALATPFGSFIAGAIKSTTAGLFNVNQAALGSAGIDVNDMVFENCDHLETEIRNATDTYTGDTCCKNCGKVMATGQTVRPKIPEGGTYYVGVTSTSTNSLYSYTAKYGPGEEFPETITNGDVYVYGDYEYRYNMYYYTDGTTKKWQNNTSQGGWGVDTKSNSKTSYGEILSNINGCTVNTIKYTFAECSSLKSDGIPAIPSCITDMSHTFWKCTSVTDFSSVVIPSGVKSLDGTFMYCSSLTNDGLPTIPYGVTTLGSWWDGVFAYCTSLTDVSKLVIPESVTDMNSAFWGCTNLTSDGMPHVPDSVTTMRYTFASCTSLTDLSNFKIPSGTKSLVWTFKGCTSLTDDGMPHIPSTVTELSSTFEGCTSLVDLSNFVIPDSVTRVGQAFQGCTSLVTAPTLHNGIVYMHSIYENCTSLKNVPAIPTSVVYLNDAFRGCTALVTGPDLSQCIKLTEMEYAFYGCTALTGTPTLSNSVQDLDYAFYGCTALTTAPVLTSGIDSMRNTFQNCTALTGTIIINSNKMASAGTGVFDGPNCFAGVDFEAQNITLSGTSWLIDEIGATGLNYCAECNGCCKGGH